MPEARPSPAPEQFALLIGAMKAGTTALWSWLVQHPAIAPSRTAPPIRTCTNWPGSSVRSGFGTVDLMTAVPVEGSTATST